MLAVGISASTLSYSPVWASGLAATVTSASQAGEKYEGIIVDANTRDPIIGATVMIKGTTTGVTTDMEAGSLLMRHAGKHSASLTLVIKRKKSNCPRLLC